MNLSRQLVTFAAIGAVSTLAYAALYAALQETTAARVANASSPVAIGRSVS